MASDSKRSASRGRDDAGETAEARAARTEALAAAARVNRGLIAGFLRGAAAPRARRGAGAPRPATKGPGA